MQKPMNDSPDRPLASVSRQVACEGIVLLENRNSALPLRSGERLSVFGRCQINTYRSGTGSGGAVNVPYAVNALEGLRANPGITLNEELVRVYEHWVEEHPFDDGGGGWATEPWFQQEMPLETELVERAAAVSDAALILIGRTAGEDKDNSDVPGSYRLTDQEVSMIETVTARFEKVIIAFNTTNIVDMSWIDGVPGKESIRAVLYTWAGGMEGGHALADVLSGDVSPSGRLVDTIAYRLEDYPSSAQFGGTVFNCYAEDIYVGYRYFETFKPRAVQYPFGAGLSYTTFEHESVTMSEHGSGAARELTCTVTVKNTGSEHAGKEVVQVYCEAPQGRLGKPARVLVGFGKTSLLAPGQTESLRISIPLASLASYDDSGATGHKSAMVLEPGPYRFYVGGSVRDARAVHHTLEVPELLVVQQLEEALAPTRTFARIKPGARLADGTYDEATEPVPQRTVSLKERIESRLPPTVPVTGNQGIALRDVKEGRASIESFVAQMGAEDLAALVRGEGMCSPRVTPGTASAFGGVTDRLCELGIPVAAAADGPSGIRMDSGHTASQVPIATLLACTWNRALNAELFALVGAQLRSYEIDTLLGPGINIHRHPLNGRNFEYFSEDPLITGTMAAAQTSGLASAGVSGTIKHFAANDQETARSDADSVVSERALREIHLRGFEMAVKEGGATSIMTAYNPLNGHWCASNYDLNTTILREQWGYTGIVMTDWWAKMNHPVEGGEASRGFTASMVRAQNDLYMVVENEKAASNPANDNTLAVLESGGLTLGELQRSAINICRFLMAAPVMDRPLAAYDPVKTFRSVSVADGDAVPVGADIDYAERPNGPLTLRVDRSGVYQVRTTARNPRPPMAQSSCSLYLNGEFAMTLSLNGTEGRPVEVSGRTVRLEAGYYTVRVDFVKPGMVLDTVRFTEIE